ncbi:esterase-like activity of phytase family protein [Rhodobacterales bacterium HKCCE3408]|nr:esterase-like activity of phytase family protein [Rhodobacterales bacterium HKCCE3408]
MRRAAVFARQLIALALCLAAAPVAAETARLNHVVWRGGPMTLGGLSGLEMTAGGTRLIAISDRGRIISAAIERDAEGRITEIAEPSIVRLLDPDGTWPSAPAMRDSEGLALMPDGDLAVSYENFHRFVVHAQDGRVRRSLPRPLQVFALQANLGFEALAVDPEGRLLAVPELYYWRRPTYPLLRLEGDRWRVAAQMPVDVPPWNPVGMDMDSDGRLYLVERIFRMSEGFRSRIRRLSFDGDGPMQAETLLETGPADYGNLEGIAVWHDAQGRTILTLVTDDNFNPFLPTEIVEFVVPD